MTIYAESSAVLAWLLGETKSKAVRSILAQADAVIASDLTLIECDRVLIRSAALKEMTEKQATRRRARLNAAAAHWNLLRIAPEITDRARRPFPIEPVRTLDALHLASALLASSATDEYAILTLDERLRQNAVEMGLAVRPQ